jgi:bifunctional NMN adenylyltransferase/nudix hydrolase
MKKYKKVVVVGRFQPLHNGHLDLINKAIELGEKVFIFIGSANSPRTTLNPFTYSERMDMILTLPGMYSKWSKEEIFINKLDDIFDDNDSWLKQITDVVGNANYENGPFGPWSSDVAIVGGAKKEWYIPLFRKPNYDHVEINQYESPTINPDKGVSVGQKSILDATDIRLTYFTKFYDDANKLLKDRVPESVFNWLKDFRYNRFYGYMASAFCTIRDLNAKYGKGPFLTCDNVIMQDNMILLVKRKNHPGKGLWAIPGGYFDLKDKSWDEGCWRELVEETSLDLSFEKYKCFRKASKIFDNPNRSLVARLITLACYVELPSSGKYHIEAKDDAADVKWFTFQEIKDMHNIMFDDHYYIIKYYIGGFWE